MTANTLFRLTAASAIALVLGFSPAYAGCGSCGAEEPEHTHDHEHEQSSTTKGSATKATTGSSAKGPAERKFDPTLPTVVFYKLPVCGVCDQVDKWIVTLDKKNKGAANFIRKDATDKKYKMELKKNGIGHHGVAILDTKANLLWSAEGHGLKNETLNKAFTKHVINKEKIVAGKVGCASCVFKLDGHSGCSVGAVEIGDKTYVLAGKTPDIHNSGLCKKAKTATLKGKFDGSTFVASDVAIK
jgi:hypothetical protein